MEDRKMYVVKKYFKDNWVQILIGYIVSITLALILGYFLQVENIIMVLGGVVAANFLSDIWSFRKHMRSITKSKT